MNLLPIDLQLITGNDGKDSISNSQDVFLAAGNGYIISVAGVFQLVALAQCIQLLIHCIAIDIGQEW